MNQETFVRMFRDDGKILHKRFLFTGHYWTFESGEDVPDEIIEDYKKRGKLQLSDDGNTMKYKWGDFDGHLQNIKVSTNLGRDDLFLLGNRKPYYRTIDFPVEIRTDLELYCKIPDGYKFVRSKIPTFEPNNPIPTYEMELVSTHIFENGPLSIFEDSFK